jgi:hypothetical protein
MNVIMQSETQNPSRIRPGLSTARDTMEAPTAMHPMMLVATFNASHAGLDAAASSFAGRGSWSSILAGAGESMGVRVHRD